MTALNSQYYRVCCMRGAISTVLYIVEVYARDGLHAYEIARSSGYTPISLA